VTIAGRVWWLNILVRLVSALPLQGSRGVSHVGPVGEGLFAPLSVRSDGCPKSALVGMEYVLRGLSS
jgi:hypothetical protein